jgi:hypothetical protein
MIGDGRINSTWDRNWVKHDFVLRPMGLSEVNTRELVF